MDEGLLLTVLFAVVFFICLILAIWGRFYFRYPRSSAPAPVPGPGVNSPVTSSAHGFGISGAGSLREMHPLSRTITVSSGRTLPIPQQEAGSMNYSTHLQGADEELEMGGPTSDSEFSDVDIEGPEVPYNRLNHAGAVTISQTI